MKNGKQTHTFFSDVFLHYTTSFIKKLTYLLINKFQLNIISESIQEAQSLLSLTEKYYWIKIGFVSIHTLKQPNPKGKYKQEIKY